MIPLEWSMTLSALLFTIGVVGVLYFMGGAGIRAFCFTMLTGLIAGTYSSIYIASPLLLWLAGQKIADAPSKPTPARV